MSNGTFNQAQQEVLMRGLVSSRVESRKQGGMNLSYLAQHDVRAHLIRMFGFGHFDLITEEVRRAYEQQKDSKSSNSKLWDVGYAVTMRLVVRDPQQNVVCEYSETAVGSALSADRGEAHDNAVKNGSSDAMKRCAINLGDQFGLSLYQGGQTAPIVKRTIVVDGPAGTPVEAPVGHEQAQEAPEDQPTQFVPSAHAVEAQKALYAFATLPAGERITEVAKFKAGNPDVLAALLDIDGQQVTVARYADLVAAGKFTE